MATYWVKNLSNIKDISGHLRRCLFIFANGTSYTWYRKHVNNYVILRLQPCLTFFQLKITYVLISSRWGLEKSELPWEQDCIVFYRTRENVETERGIEGVGWGTSIPPKLFLVLDGNGSLFPPEVRMIPFTVDQGILKGRSAWKYVLPVEAP